jgi:outer membrane protein OmpA-like peptidoglycan-associated protein/uncharacterized coiled-coil DUF342 family protein
MRAFLIAAVVCITGFIFYLAATLTSSMTEEISAEQSRDVQAVLDARLAESQSGMTAEIANLQEAGSALEAEINMLSQSVESLTAERDDLAGKLVQSQADFDVASAEFAAQSERLTENMSDISDLETVLAERDTRLADADATIQTLNKTIATNRAELATASGQLSALQQEADSAAARIAELESGSSNAAPLPDDTEEQLSLLQAQIAERDTLIASLETQLVEVGTPNEEINTQITSLTAAVEERDATIAALETTQIEAAEAIAAAEQDETNAQIEALTSTLAERDATIAALEAIQAEAVAIDNAESQTTLTSEQEAEVANFGAQIAQLNALVAEQTATIESLRLGFNEEPASAQELADACIARANSFLENAQIGFGIGTAAINEGSVSTLERLGDLAIGCQNESLIIEIGGHTDSQGPAADNQLLSERRAQAVLDFMLDRGVQSDSARAVGFGETQPIESNDTNAGRAANRRITFEWQNRETASDPVDE